MTTDPNYYTLMMGVKRMAAVQDADPQWNIIMAAVVMAMLPPILIVIFMQRLFVKGLVETEK
ncbi:glycerol-3-phosphate transporter membrane protein [compost metagenome]